MSTRHTLYQLRRQKARYDLPTGHVEVWNEWWVVEPVIPRDVVATLAVAIATVIVLFCMLWYACDLAVDLAQQAYGVVI